MIRVPLGEFAAQPDGSLKRYRAGWRAVWVWRRAERLQGYYDSCTHQGGALMQKGDQMVCSRHQAAFDAASGERRAGEAPEGSRLPVAELEVADGKIVLLMPESDV